MSLTDAIKNLHATLAASAGVGITYSRGAASVQVQAARGQVNQQEWGEDGFSLQANLWSFLVRADELVLDDVQVLPQLRDEITVVEGGATKRYEVTDSGGERCYRYSDQFKTMLRIFTVEL